MRTPLLVVLLLASISCSTPQTDNPLDAAASAKAREARLQIRRMERRLIANSDPRGFDYQSFVLALQNAGRAPEADALTDYTERTFRGEHTNKPLTTQQARDCEDLGIVRRWGAARSQQDEYTGRVGRPAAKFWVGSDARIEKIRVLRAMDPGAAWLLIDSIGEARVSKSRVRRIVEADSEEFPLELCTSWYYDEPRDRLPGGNKIRGFN